MATLALNKKDIPFLLRGKGEFTVDTADLALGKPIAETTTSVLSVGFKAAGEQKIALGQDDSVKLGVSTAASANLTPVFSTSAGGAKALTPYGLRDFFKGGAHSDQVVLVFDVGASADVSADGSFQYSALKASVEIDAGVEGGYTYVRALDKKLPVQQILPEFFLSMRLPAAGTRAPEAGEAIALRYGGYLRLAAEVSAGYKLGGTKSVSLGQLALSEKYNLAILGKVGLAAGVAGRFSILVSAADGLDGWARVQVRRHRAKDLKISADVTVDFKNELTGLPADAHEFLGAVLGTNAKNFLNVFDKALELSDFEKLKTAIDGLAKKYIEEFIGKGFDKLASQAEFTKFLDRVRQVVKSYETVEDRAITLFDRHFDKLDELTTFLGKIDALSKDGLARLRQEINPHLWTILAQLTDGDPLGFLLDQVTVKGFRVDSLLELQKRARAALDLIQNTAHAEIRRVIALAKQSFGIDTFFRQLAKVDTVDELQALANDKVGMFVTRLVGRSLDSATNLKEALKEVHAVLSRIDAFTETLFKAFKEAVNSSYKVALHAEYSRASESDALIDVLINMADGGGPTLLRQAGQGDFEEILAIADADRVRLQEGVFTHRTRRESAFKVNIVGWHLNYQYEGFDRVITETEQRLIPSDQGITVLSTATLQVERQRKRQNEEMHMNFLLRALGASKAAKPDPVTKEYLIDALSSLTARYQLNFTDPDTTTLELEDYLAFAKDLGLDKRGATLGELTPLLPRTATGTFGRIDASYDVRFGQQALEALLKVTSISKEDEAFIRGAMRQMVLSNYLKSDRMHDIAFAYATPAVFEVFSKEGFAKFESAIPPQREFSIALSNAGIAAPATVKLDQDERRLLSRLYNVEESFVSAIKELYKVLNDGPISPVKFEQKLGKFGDALKNFDKVDQASNEQGVGTSTIFAMFDTLVRRASAGAPANASVLRLTSQVNGENAEKLFMSAEA